MYIFEDDKGDTLYVGKAINLKKRLSSYFNRSGLTPKTMVMVKKIARVEIQQTRTEGEALLLESNLIKDRRPRYNISLRDDKSFPYIRLSSTDDFPRFSFYRGNRIKSDVYFGPYPNAAAVREMLSQLSKIFRLRQCEGAIFRYRTRPCLQYQIKRCSAPCVGLVDQSDYLDDIRQAQAILTGQDSKLIDELAGKMEKASTELDYERAALYRDRIALLQRIRENQYVSGTRDNTDLIAVSTDSGKVCFGVVQIRHGRNLGGRYYIDKLPLDDDPASLLSAFLPQHYLGHSIAREVIVSHHLDDVQSLAVMLADDCGHVVRIRSNVRSHRARWIESCQINTADYLRRQLNRHDQVEKGFSELSKALDLPEVPSRIECFDISHTQGENTVAGCVVFDQTGALKSDYRRFNIKDVEPGDDYAAMKQAVERRYRRVIEHDGKLPDILLIDGGKGQLSTVKNILAEIDPDHAIMLIAVSKGAARKAGDEKLHLPGRRQPVILKPTSVALHLIQLVRDEAHRFAITSHRGKRAKKRNQSPLQQIAGIGDKRRRQLLRYFGGIRAIRRAGIEELSQAPGISPELARRIYDRFHD